MPANGMSARSSILLKTIGTVRTAFEWADAERKLLQYKIRHFEPNVRLSFERGNYLVKTADCGEELEQCLRLRYEVFHKEYMHKNREYGVDVDELDLVCDHLMIINQANGEVIGTYRLNSSRFTDGCYSENEFHMKKILELQGPLLELGRACIDRSHRTGVVIALLWRGIADYIRKTDSKVLYGCSSIKTIDPLEIALITKHLRDNNQLTYEFDVTATAKYKINQLPKMLEYLDQNPSVVATANIQGLIPPLFKSYLKMGAKMCSEPALDREFSCIDFLTVVRTDSFNASIKDRYEISDAGK